MAPTLCNFSMQNGMLLFPLCHLLILNSRQQGDLNKGTTTLRRPLDAFMKSIDSGTTVWRHSLFDPPPEGGLFSAGVLNMFLGWFQQSHDVSFWYKWFAISLSTHILFKQLSEQLYVSSDIRSNEAAKFLSVTAGLDVLSNAITALVAPQRMMLD